MIEPQSIEQLLERSRLEEVVAQFVDLGQRGANRKAPECPFCNAKKKFSVSVPKQLFKCFECNEGGVGPVNFLMKHKAMPYLQAVQWLADFYKFELVQVPKDADAGPEFDQSYFNQRMTEIGYHQDRTEGRGIFRPHSSGGVEIRFPRLRFEQGQSPWQQDGSGDKEQDFARVRLHPTRVTSTQKYSQPKGSGVRIFIPPAVVELYRTGQQFPTLYLVEGEFKAYALSLAGVPIVGLTGINMYHREKGSKELHPDLMELLRVGRCSSTVIIHDADCMQVRWDPIAEPSRDLGERLKNFAGAVSGFRLAIGGLVQRIYFSRIRPEYADKAKGLDDLAGMRGKDDVAEHLQRLKSTDMFVVRDVTEMTWRGINGEFSLNFHKGVPKQFYDSYQGLIGDRSFVFLKGTYRYDMDAGNGDGELVMERHADSEQYIRVGCDYYRIIITLDEHGKPVKRRVPWKESVINRDYVHKGSKNFYDTIEVFDAYDNNPGHHEDYQPFIVTETGRLYNSYHPLSHIVKQGAITRTTDYLKHIFTDREVESVTEDGIVLAKSPAWEAYMDYLTIMYRQPRMRLPAVALVSQAKQTGKSKLLELNCALWEGNATMLGNDQLNDPTFNGDWVNAQFVGVDETLLDKKHSQERMKRLITGSREQARSMYKDREMTKLIAKFHFASNNVGTFINIDDDEFRYWVLEVGKVEKKDPMLLDKMVAEIPALFHTLRHRPITHPRLGRLWFADSVLETEARQEVARNSKGWCEGDIRTFMEDQFYRIRWPELYFPVIELTKRVNETTGSRHRPKEVKRVLEQVMNVGQVFDRVTVPAAPDQRQRDRKVGEMEKQRWFVFRACDFVPESTAAEIMAEACAEWAVATDSINEGGGREGMPLYVKHPTLELEPA